MKKNFKSIFAAFAAFVIVVSCSKVDELYGNDENAETGGLMTISATLSDNMTKVSFDPVYYGGKPQSLALAWESGDKLRIYDHVDKTKYEDFLLDERYAGQKTGYFTGNAFEAVSYDVEIISGDDVEYASQTQPSDGVTTSLKYLACASGIADLKTISFTEFSSVLAITAKLPEGVAAVVGSVDITASEPIFNAGNKLSINLAQKGDADEDGILHLFASLPRGNQSIAEGTTLLVHFNAPGTDHTVYTRFVELDASAFTAGKLNTININASESDRHAGLASCDGTSAEKAYLIGDKYQMQAMNTLMTADATTYFKMVDDVDMEGIAWTPLNGTSPYTNAIDFDGAGHKIVNLATDGTKKNSSFAAVLIGNMRNVTFDKAVIEGGGGYTAVVAAYLGYSNTTGNCNKVFVTNSSVNCSNIAGGLAGAGQLVGDVTECGVINAEIISTDARVGGFIGSLVKFDNLSDCYAENVTVESTANYYVGGFIGQLQYDGVITGCHSTGITKATNGRTRIGGLIGDMLAGTVTDCYSSCNIESSGAFNGGLIGQMENGKVQRCYSTGNVISTGHYQGGLIGMIKGNVELSKCYATGTVGDNSKNWRGGLIGAVGDPENLTNADVSVLNCYTNTTINSNSYSGGFVGGVAENAKLSVTDSYTKSIVNGNNWHSCVFSGPLDGTLSTCDGFIGWNVSGRNAFYSKGEKNALPSIAVNTYMGTEGTISAKAKEFGWDETIWDLSGDDPLLKWTLGEDDSEQLP